MVGGCGYCVGVPSQRPSPPVGLSLAPGVGSLTASWGVPVRSEGDAAAVGYAVEWRRERSGDRGRAVVTGARSFAFTNLSIGTGRFGMEHFVVGSPPRDLDGNDYYNAYRYVILHRAPKGTNPNPNSNPNTFTQLMNGSQPVVLTQEQLNDMDPQDDVGYLDSNGHFVLTDINLADAAFADCRSQGHEFVLVGVTRGNPQRGPDKPLNPVSAAGLAHAVMSLDLGPSTGLAGAHNWMLGTPVLHTRP